MKKIFIAAVLLITNSAFASHLTLNDGLYDVSNPSICAHRVTNDLTNKRIYLQGMSIPGKHCADATIYKWSYAEGDAYLNTSDILVNEDLLNRCAVVNGLKPCSPQTLLYDKNNKLVIQQGDILKDGSQLRVLNSEAFSAVPAVIHTRNGKVINSNFDHSREYIANKLRPNEISDRASSGY